MARPSRAVLTLVTMGALSAPALAQWSPDPNVNNAVFSGAEDQAPAVAVSDGAGGVIVAWRHARFDSGTFSTFYSLRAQRIDSMGVVRWAAGGVVLVTDTVAAQANLLRPPFAAIADGNGGVIVAWRDGRADAGDIYARRVDASGVVQWTAEGVAVGAATDLQTRPVLASDGAGGAIVAWEDRRNGLGNTDIFAQRVTALGALPWGGSVPVCTELADQLLPVITADGANGAVLAWVDTRASAQEIFAQRLTPAGATSWTASGVALTSVSGIQNRPSLAADGTGGAIVAWEDDRNGADNDIYARRVDATGNALWTANGVSVAPTANATFPVVVPDGAGGAIITWSDDRNGTTDVFAQRLDAAGAAQWVPANGVTVTSAAGGQFFPAAVADGAGGVVIGWEDGRNGLNDVFAQRLDASGSALWAGGGRPVSTAAQAQGGVTVAPDGSGGGLFAWLDGRTPANGQDVYAAHVDGSGALPVTLERFTVE